MRKKSEPGSLPPSRWPWKYLKRQPDVVPVRHIDDRRARRGDAVVDVIHAVLTGRVLRGDPPERSRRRRRVKPRLPVRLDRIDPHETARRGRVRGVGRPIARGLEVLDVERRGDMEAVRRGRRTRGHDLTESGGVVGGDVVLDEVPALLCGNRRRVLVRVFGRRHREGGVLPAAADAVSHEQRVGIEQRSRRT